MLKKIYLVAIGVLLVGCDSKPKDTAYYLKNEKERQEILSRCEVVPFDFSQRERPAKEDCDNAEIAQLQVDIYKMTGQQDSKEYFFNNPDIRERVLKECQDPFGKDITGATSVTPCINAFNTEKEIRVNILKRETKGLEKVEDFLKGGDNVIKEFRSHCRMNRPYLDKEPICANVNEAYQKKAVIDLEEMTAGKNDVDFFLANPKILRDVYSYCDYYGKLDELTDLIKNHPICKNALIAAKNY